jgi:uncharacterized protein GlcG (DUF336 family)
MNVLFVNLETARRLIEAVEAKAKSIDCPVNTAVVDAGGNLVAHARMDNARIGAIDIAINKAWTARAFDMDTAELGGLSQPGAPFFGHPRLQWRPRHASRWRHATTPCRTDHWRPRRQRRFW